MMKMTLCILLLIANPAFGGGNKELMERAEARLCEINHQVLDLVSREAIPVNGCIQLSASVKQTNSELMITNLKVTTMESTRMREGTLLVGSSKQTDSCLDSVAGNQELMARAEVRLRDMNRIILEHVSKEAIPENGRIHLNATVKNTKPELTITNLEVTTMESKNIREGKLLYETTN